jgi:hypothetical protein
VKNAKYFSVGCPVAREMLPGATSAALDHRWMWIVTGALGEALP